MDFIKSYICKGLISYLIIFRITKSINYSLVGSIFFIFSTIMIHRITEYPATFLDIGLYYFILYTELLDKNKKFKSQNISYFIKFINYSFISL